MHVRYFLIPPPPAPLPTSPIKSPAHTYRIFHPKIYFQNLAEACASRTHHSFREGTDRRLCRAGKSPDFFRPRGIIEHSGFESLEGFYFFGAGVRFAPINSTKSGFVHTS